MSAVYKPGQGYWTRTMSAIGFGLVVLMGAAWVKSHFETVRIGAIQSAYITWGAFVIVAAIGGILIYRFIGRRERTVDFLIATETEMKKVNWSSRKEVLGMTWVVIGLTAVIAAFVAVFDVIYTAVFTWIHVLDK